MTLQDRLERATAGLVHLGQRVNEDDLTTWATVQELVAVLERRGLLHAGFEDAVLLRKVRKLEGFVDQMVAPLLAIAKRPDLARVEDPEGHVGEPRLNGTRAERDEAY